MPAISAVEPIQYFGVLITNPLRLDPASAGVRVVISVGAVDFCV
jgi:hypothetical protein